MENRNILINMLIYKETVMRRERKMKAMCEGLLFMNFGKYLNENHFRLLFLSFEIKVTTDKLKIIFYRERNCRYCPGGCKAKVFRICRWCQRNLFKKILKFSTGFEDINNLRRNEITIDFLQDEVLPKALACLGIIFLPLRCIDKNMFILLLQQALEF